MIQRIETKFDEVRRRQAEIFGALANVVKLSTLKTWQLEKILDDARECSLHLSKANLAESHRWAHYLINRCLDNGRVDVSEFEKRLPRPIELWNDRKSTAVRLDFDTKRDDDRKWVFYHLWNIVTLHPFPFRRCPVCRTIFVAAGKKKYCSPKCSDLSLGPRTEYMRGYMKKIRARAKRRKVHGDQ